MRPILNRYERAREQNMLAQAAHDFVFSEIDFVVNQPMELISRWMDDIALPEHMQLTADKKFTARISILRQMYEPGQIEPSFGRVCVLSIPATGIEDSDYHQMIGKLESRVVWHRFEDFYGPAVAKAVIGLAKHPSFYSTDIAILPISDVDTSFVLVVREPSDTLSGEELNDFATRQLNAVFTTLAKIESGDESLSPVAREKLPLPVRLLQTGNPEDPNAAPVLARGHGIDIDIVLNGCTGNHIIDHAYISAFWHAFISYLTQRPEHEVLKGLSQATVKVKPADTYVAMTAENAARPDNIDAVLGS
ncbi:MAG TPA: hypothetical protein VN081_04975 [Dongiaceae bacterium]|nr:hypothetical protein [Dongiaceae bacterium]